jgi:hypothetical protein
VALGHRLLAHQVDGVARLVGIHEQPSLDRRLVAELPGLALGPRVDLLGAVEGLGRTVGDHVALDPVEAVAADVLASVVETGQVPAAPAEVEAVRVDETLHLAVGQPDPAPLGDGFEQERQAGVGRQGGHGLPGRRPGAEPVGVDHPAELPEGLVVGRAADLHGGDGQVEGGQLVGLQPGVCQVVLVPGDAVAVPGRVHAGDGLDDERHAQLPEVVLVPLEGPVERGAGLRVARDLLPQLLGTQRPGRVQEHGDEVHQPLELVDPLRLGHGPPSLRPRATRPEWRLRRRR